jgi:hypothetical protein
MGSVATVNPGVADVLQTLSGAATGSLSSALSSSGVQSALQKAPPADIVPLSQLAQQLVEANGLFGSSSASQTVTDPATLLLQAVNSSLTGSTTPASSSTSPEQALVAGLFGLNPTVG